MLADLWPFAVALIFACGCEMGPPSALPAVAAKPAAVTNGPHLVGAVSRPEPTLLAPSHAPVVGLAVGAHHSCAVHQDGAVSCWGWSAHGQLGVTDPDQSPVPIGVAVADVVEISADGDATCARQRSGRIVCWGELQNSNIDEPPRATQIGDAAQLSGTCARTITGDVRCIDRGLYTVEVPIHDAVTIAARYSRHGCAIISGGTVRCWHYVFDHDEPTLEVRAVDVRDPVELAVGWTFACARSASGGVSCWDFDLSRDSGIGKPHALGITDATALAASSDSLCIEGAHHPIRCVYPTEVRAAPHELTELAGRTVGALAIGDGHGCALTNGRVACWGDNFDGEVGNGWADTSSRARRVPGLEDVEQVVAAGDTTCVRHRDGTVACFGELPDPSPPPPKPCVRTRRDYPTPLLCWAPTRATAKPTLVAAMPSSSPCVIAGGALSCGSVHVAGTRDLVAVTTAQRYACVLARDGTTACYRTRDGAPVAMPALDHARSIEVTIQTVGFADHEPELCALRDDQSVACVLPKMPAPVVRAVGAVALAANAGTACVVLADGRAGCWGVGTYGILGRGRTALHDDIGYVRGLANAVDISVGRIHACARLADGGVACWGYGAGGQTGLHVYERVESAVDVAF